MVLDAKARGYSTVGFEDESLCSRKFCTSGHGGHVWERMRQVIGSCAGNSFLIGPRNGKCQSTGQDQEHLSIIIHHWTFVNERKPFSGILSVAFARTLCRWDSAEAKWRHTSQYPVVVKAYNEPQTLQIFELGVHVRTWSVQPFWLQTSNSKRHVWQRQSYEEGQRVAARQEENKDCSCDIDENICISPWIHRHQNLESLTTWIDAEQNLSEMFTFT